MTVHDAENHEEFEYVKFATIRTIDADEKAILFFGFEEKKTDANMNIFCI